MTQAEYETRLTRIDRALAEGAIPSNHSPSAWQSVAIVAAFAIPCMLGGALISGIAIVFTKVYLG